MKRKEKVVVRKINEANGSKKKAYREDMNRKVGS